MADADVKNQRNLYYIGGAVFFAIGIFLFQACPEEPRLGCEVSALGIAVIAEGLSHGRSPDSIVARVGNVAGDFPANDLCQQAVTTFVHSPAESVVLEVDTSQGIEPVTISGTQLTPTAALPTDCDDWASQLLIDSCRSGAIAPPSIDLNPGNPTCADWLLPSFVNLCATGTIGPPTEE